MSLWYCSLDNHHEANQIHSYLEHMPDNSIIPRNSKLFTMLCRYINCTHLLMALLLVYANTNSGDYIGYQHERNYITIIVHTY